jgi:hypothetical protein
LQHVWPLPQQRKCRNWSAHHASLLRTLRQQPDLLPRGCRVLLAVSGGQVGTNVCFLPSRHIGTSGSKPALIWLNAQKLAACACRHTLLLATHACVTCGYSRLCCMLTQLLAGHIATVCNGCC